MASRHSFKRATADGGIGKHAWSYDSAKSDAVPPLFWWFWIDNIVSILYTILYTLKELRWSMSKMMRINDATAEQLENLTKITGKSKQDLIAKAIDALARELFLKKTNEEYEQ